MLLRSRRVNAHLLAGLVVPLELDHPVDLGEERVIAALADVVARVELCPALTHDDRSRVDLLAVVALHAEVLRFAVSAVS